jgi:hypothetical protein
VRITSAPADSPLYEVQAKARPTRGSTVEVVIKTEEEPLYREFFTRVGQLRGARWRPEARRRPTKGRCEMTGCHTRWARACSGDRGRQTTFAPS